MANVQRYGFWVAKELCSGEPVATKWEVNSSTAGAIDAGDAVILSQGYAAGAASTSGSLLGVAAADSSADGYVLVYDDPNTVFCGITSGTYASTLRGKICDIEGSSGAMMVNEDATTESVVGILREVPAIDNEIGTYTKVYFRILKHNLNGDQTA